MAALLLLPCLLHAQTSAVPNRISYQGIVTDGTGNLVGDTSPENHEVIFRVWDHPTASAAGNLVYSEKQVVTIGNGKFSVLIGAGADVTGEESKGPGTVDVSDVFTGNQRFLGVTVAAAASPAVVTGSDVEITPRQQMVSSAFTFRAKEAETVVDGSISTDALADGSITLAKLGSGAVNSTTIVNSSITASDLANSSVTSNKLAGNTVNSDKIVDASIATVDLADGAVTAAKLGSDVGLWSVSGANIFRSGRVAIGEGFSEERGNLIVAGGDNAAGEPAMTIRPAGGTPIAERSILTFASRFKSFPSDPAPRRAADLVAGFDTNTFGSRYLAFGVGGSNSTSGVYMTERMRIQENGNVGIGTASPNTRLTVQTPSNSTGFRHTDGNINLETLVQTLGAQIGTGTNHSFGLFTNNTNRMMISASGNVGIGTTSPSHPLHVKAGGTFDVLKLETSNGKHWALNINGGNGVMELRSTNSPSSTIATINPTSGAYAAVSDRRLKSRIKELEPVLDQVMKLAPASYWFKAAEDAPLRSLGFISQDVEKIFPEVVHEIPGGMKSIEYTAMIPLAIGAIQELKHEQDEALSELLDENADLKATVTELQERLADLEAKDKARDAKLVAIEALLKSMAKPPVQTASLEVGAE